MFQTCAWQFRQSSVDGMPGARRLFDGRVAVAAVDEVVLHVVPVVELHRLPDLLRLARCRRECAGTPSAHQPSRPRRRRGRRGRDGRRRSIWERRVRSSRDAHAPRRRARRRPGPRWGVNCLAIDIRGRARKGRGGGVSSFIAARDRSHDTNREDRGGAARRAGVPSAAPSPEGHLRGGGEGCSRDPSARWRSPPRRRRSRCPGPSGESRGGGTRREAATLAACPSSGCRARWSSPIPRHAEPDGLLAVGGDLSPRRLLAAYARGDLPLVRRRQPDPLVVARSAARARPRRSCTCPARSSARSAAGRTA